MAKESKKMSKTELEFVIGNSRKMLKYTLDELEELMKLTPKDAKQQYIVEHYNNKEIIAYQCYHSNKIEGSRVTLSDTDRIINGDFVSSDRYSAKDINEVRGFIQAYRRSVRYLTNSTISVPIIKDLHKNLMQYTDPSIAGIYRTGGATIYGMEDFIKFAKPDSIDRLLSEAIERYNFGIIKNPILFEACKFKVAFINIHPFSDGNGRTSRILLNCMLISGGMIPIVIKDNQRIGYKRAMQVGYQSQMEGIAGGYLPLLQITVDGLISGYKNVIRSAGLGLPAWCK